MMTAQQQYLDAMGIDVWQRRDLPAAVIIETSPPETVSSELKPTVTIPVVADNVGIMEWDPLRSTVASCELCSLHTTRTQTVFGTGDQQAQLMIISDAPGVDENRQGEPFVGRAGQLLNEMLRAIGFKREQVYIAYITKCRPSNNTAPQAAEMSSCHAYLQRQIALVQPVVILAVGELTAQYLLKRDETLADLRGKEHRYPGSDIPVIATYHPAFLLDSSAEKRNAWHDLLMARAIVAENIKHKVTG